MSYREDGFIGPDYIARCPTCGHHADLYSRWRYVGARSERLYVFVSCDRSTYCPPGRCFKTAKEAIDDWNEPYDSCETR